MEICRLENISKTYTMEEKICPLKNISLKINLGDFISIEGPSGIGKSTMLYVMGSLLKPDEGKLYLDGKDTSELTDQQLTSLRAHKIGFIFQETNLIQALTLQENIEFAQSLGYKYKVKHKEISDLLTKLGLHERKNFLPNQLSVGQRRRAIAAVGFIKQPKIILADEPTNDLDDFWAKEIIQLLTEAVQNGSAVVMVTHSTKWASKSKFQYKLDEGQLVMINRGIE